MRKMQFKRQQRPKHEDHSSDWPKKLIENELSPFRVMRRKNGWCNFAAEYFVKMV
jgi:hypothetical protein